MNDTLFRIKEFFSKFLHLGRMGEKFRLLDYTKFNPQKTIIFDVDHTILIATNRDYVHAKPIKPMIQKINRLHKRGWTIILCTARGQLSKNGNMKLIEKLNRPVLEKWLKQYKVQYDYLLFEKPYGLWYVDDKSLTPLDFLRKEF